MHFMNIIKSACMDNEILSINAYKFVFHNLKYTTVNLDRRELKPKTVNDMSSIDIALVTS